MAKIVKLKIPLIFFSEFCPSNNSRPVLMLIVTQEKRLGVNIWPIIGIIKPRSWPKLSGTYGIRTYILTILVVYIKRRKLMD